MLIISGTFLCLCSFLFGVNGISIDNGRYEDITIVIQDSVEEDEALLERIKEVFTKTSQMLFQATRQHVYFGQINIILPNTWGNKPEYTEIPARSELETYITVDNGKVKTPHTKRKNAKCGHPGWYIYLHTDFLLTEGKTKWGYHENVLVHEWGHFRWGLFEEYSTDEDFYMDLGILNPSRCNTRVNGTVGKGENCSIDQRKCDIKEKVMDKDCKFCPHESQSEYNMSSIMAFNWVDGVSTFCDNETDQENQRHNGKAYNKHNTECGKQSAWEVMRQHPVDFKRAQLPAHTNTTPVFNLLRETDRCLVFVLDTSGSMDDRNRIKTLTQASEYIIQAKIPLNSLLGIVWFSSSASTHMNITQVTSQDVRDALISVLPQTAGGKTCIGCGIEEALKILRDYLPDPAGSEIIVISDGRDNVESVNLSTSVVNAKNANVIIHSISVSDDADTRMISMAAETGGKHVSYLETGLISFASTFMEILSSGVTSHATESTTLCLQTFEHMASNSTSYSFDIDSGIGKNTTVSILHESSADLQVDVVSPTGNVYTEQSAGNNIILDIPGTAQAGQYNFTITTLSTNSLPSFEYYVTSLPTGPEVIRISSWVSPIELDFFTGELPVIEADVMKGRAAVLNALVTAVTETAYSTHCNVSLLDDGLDPDVTKYDGVYAGVIPRFCLVNGRISAKVYASGVNGTASVQDVFSGAGSSESDDVKNIEILQESFQRVTLTNDILISNYSSEIAKQDVTAPGRIKDVSIINISTKNSQYGESRNYTITWTATGDDMNIGLAKEYELRISNSWSALVNTFSAEYLLDVVSANFTPKASGETEYIKIEIDAEESYTSTTFFGVRAKDEAGNTGEVSNIVSILVANGYRIKVEVDVDPYKNTEEGIEEYHEQEEKEKNLTGLAIGLSSTAALILISIIVASICLKKLKAKESVEDCEFGSRASTTAVFTIEKPLQELFTSMDSSQTVAKKTFMSSQLPTIPEREQIWTNTFSKRPISPYSRKPFDIISQGECSIEMLNGAANDAFVDQMEGYLNVDNDSIFSGHMSSRSTCSTYDEETTNKSLAESESDILPGEATETHSDVEKNQCKFLSVVEGFANDNEMQTPEEIKSNEGIPGVAAVSQVNNISQQRKKGFKREPRDAYSEERSVTCPSLSVDFPAFDSNEISLEISKMYEDVHFEQ